MRCLCVGASPKEPAKKSSSSARPRGGASWRRSDDGMRSGAAATTTAMTSGSPTSSSSSPTTISASPRLVHHQSPSPSDATKPTEQSLPYSRTLSKPVFEGLDGSNSSSRGLRSRGTTRQAAVGSEDEHSATWGRSDTFGAPPNSGNNFCSSHPSAATKSLPPAFAKSASLPRQRFTPNVDRGTSTGAVGVVEDTQPHCNGALSSLFSLPDAGFKSTSSLGSISDHAPNGEASSSSSSSVPHHRHHRTILRSAESLPTSGDSRQRLLEEASSGGLGRPSSQKFCDAAERSQVRAEDGRLATSMFLSIGHVQDVPIDPSMDISNVRMVAVLHLDKSEDPAELLNNRKRATKPAEAYHDQAASIGSTINTKMELEIGEFGMNEIFRVAIFLRDCGENDVFVGTTGRLCAKMPQLSRKAIRWPLVNRQLRRQAGAVKLHLEINSGEKHFKLGQHDVV